MKKIHVIGLTLGLAVALQGGKPAEAKYGAAGCGLGSIVFENDNSKMQILAATTNGTFGSQTFGITTGTSNCSTGGTARSDEKELQMFAEANLKQLSRDMANGSGEYVTAMGSLLGCSEKADFASFTQSHYESIFPTSQATAADVVQNIKAGVKADAKLASTCTKV